MLHKKTHVLTALALALAIPALAQEENCGVTATVQLVEPDCGENANGSVLITAAGGVEPYTYYLLGNVVGAYTDGLAAGTYDYWVEDADKCWFKADFTLECKEEENCSHRTQTMGGWGAPPNGNNPAMYLQNHFVSCFPNGVTIGCLTGNTLTLTTSTAVKNFLPSGSTAGQLPNDLVNPGGGYNNVLAGQLTAAVINITVDGCDPDFSAATGWSGDVTYVGGTFAGWSVAELVDAANQFIGGCGSSYSATQFNQALTQFNENYNGGITDNGNFACGNKDDKKSMILTGGDLGLYPNPATEEITVSIDLANAGTGSLIVTDLAGRVVMNKAVLASKAGQRQLIVSVSELATGTYTMVLAFDGYTKTSRFVVNK